MNYSIKKFALPLSAVTLAFASVGASAATVTLHRDNFPLGSEAVRADFDPSGNTSYQNINAGAFGMSVNAVSGTTDFTTGSSILAWCIELTQNLPSTNLVYSIATGTAPSWMTTMQTLVNQRYQEVLSAASSITSAAMQLAVWEVVSGGTNLSGGNFRAQPLSTNLADSTAAINLAQSWLNALGTANSTGDYRIVRLTNANTQDLISIIENPISAVPLPGAALLFLSALGIGGAARRKRAVKAQAVA